MRYVTHKHASRNITSSDKGHGVGARASIRSSCMLLKGRSKETAHCTETLVTTLFNAKGLWVLSSLPVHFGIAVQ
jgi:hypothetical protein